MLQFTLACLAMILLACGGGAAGPKACASRTDCDPGERCQDNVCVAVDMDGSVGCDPATDPLCECRYGSTQRCGEPDGTGGVNTVGECRAGSQDCLATGLWDTCAGAQLPEPETCNMLDDDCDGSVDNGVGITCWVDGDGDGFAAAGAMPFGLCDPACPMGTTATAPTGPADTDCYDDNAAVMPGQLAFFATDRGDGSFDYDCDGMATPEITTIGVCPPRCTGAVVGWSGAVPACGVVQPYVSGCRRIGFSLCQPSVPGEFRTQACR